MWFSHELFLYGLWVFSIFCVSQSYTLQSPLWHCWKTQQSPVPGHLLHLLSARALSSTLGPQCLTGVPGVTIVQNITLSPNSLQCCFIPAKFGSITIPSLRLCKDFSQTNVFFDPEVGNKDATEIQEGWWETGSPRGLNKRKDKGYARLQVWISRKPYINHTQRSHEGVRSTGREVAALEVSV